MSDKHIVLGLEGAMMSFGTTGQFFIRNTDAYPSKSAIVGMICAAMGEFTPSETLLASLSGNMDVDGYTATRFSVFTDMQNMGAGYDDVKSNETDEHKIFMSKRRLVRTNSTKTSMSASKISFREYLTDVKYKIVLTLPSSLADRVIAAMKDPAHGPFLGRKTCAPTSPVFRSVHTRKADAMAEELFHKSWRKFIIVRDGFVDIGKDITPLRRVVRDVPVSFDHYNKKYTSRQISYHIIPEPVNE